MSEFQKIISGYNDQMPSKAKKANYPHMIWIKAPLHNCFRPQTNNLRGKFNACLDKMGKLQLNTSVLELKKIWDPEDSALVLPGTDILTAKGCTTYWEAVDRTVKYCDTTTLRKEAAKEFKEIKNPKMGYQHHFHYCQKSYQSNDRYHWNRQLSGQHDRDENKGHHRRDTRDGSYHR